MYPKYSLFKKIFLSNFLRLSFPYKLTFAITYRCNLSCQTCFIWKKEHRRELSLAEIEHFFRKSNDFSWLDLTGGEIFLREDLLEVIKIIFNYCRSLCIFHFPTNGQLTEKIIKVAEKIRDYKKNIIFIITVSMDGPKEVNNRIRGHNDAWDNSLRTFIELKKRKFNFVYLGYTLSKYNFGTLQGMLSEIQEHYPHIQTSDIHINIAHTSTHYFNNSSLDFNTEPFFNKDIMNFRKTKNNIIKKFLEKKYLDLSQDYLHTRRMPLRCQALSSSCFMDPYGDIYPCTIYDRKIVSICDMEYDLSKVWRHDNAVSVRTQIINKKCKGCWTPCEAYPAILGSIFKRQQ